MAQMQLFVIFPEYVDNGFVATAPYISTIDLSDANKVEAFIAEFERMIMFFSYEDYDGYYDAKNIKAFSIPLETLEDCYPGHITVLRNVMNKWNDWRDEPTPDNGQQYYYHSTSLSNDTLSEIAKRKQQAGDNFLVINHKSIDHGQKQLPVFNQHGEDRSIEQLGCNIKELHTWFGENRLPERVFRLNPKHGENGKKNFKGESVLLCSHAEAEKLLHKAIGNSGDRTLHYYDKKNTKYIEFKAENTGNSYHAFHVENNIVCHRISKEVKKKIDKITLE